MTHSTDTHKFIALLDETKLLTILEGFLLSVNDANVYEELAEKLDISDDELFDIREKVQDFLDKPGVIAVQ